MSFITLERICTISNSVQDSTSRHSTCITRRHSRPRTSLCVRRCIIAQRSASISSPDATHHAPFSDSRTVSYTIVVGSPTFAPSHSETVVCFSMPAATSAMRAAPTPEPSLAIPMRMRLAPSSPIPSMARSAS